MKIRLQTFLFINQSKLWLSTYNSVIFYCMRNKKINLRITVDNIEGKKTKPISRLINLDDNLH